MKFGVNSGTDEIHSRLVTSALALDPDSFHHCPGRGSRRSNIGKNARGQESARKSHAFKILTFKIFVMKILRGISPVEVCKLLILDILKDRGGEGGRVTKR